MSPKFRELRTRLALSVLLCPKFRDLQTGKGTFTFAVSEVEIASDKDKHFLLCCVRSLENFRQRKILSPLLCPKLKELRTRIGTFNFAVSEVEIASDKERNFLLCCVRS